MAADVNGFSMGYRDAMIENGVEFFFTNVHCHHGMYPLYQNQNAFFWENASGQRLLVWNGEHYNLGNVLGLQPNHAVNWMMRNRLGEDADAGTSFSDQLHTNLDKYLTECETEGYPYDFIVTAVSGVFSDNAPPSVEIMETIRAYNKKYGQEVRVEMVSLQELYAAIAPKLTDAPVYRGDWTDWWANGVGSTPYAVKHYKDADHRWQLANRLDPDAETHYPALAEAVQDNLMLYAEHTWGHSSTITNPYDTMVLNLDMRKNSYASKAHEAASLMLCSIAEKKGDMLRYYMVVVQNVHHRDAVKGGEHVRKFRRKAAVKCAAFQIPIEPFLHANHGGNVFLQQTKAVAAPAHTVGWIGDFGVGMVHMEERLCFRSGVRPGKRHLQDVERG